VYGLRLLYPRTKQSCERKKNQQVLTQGEALHKRRELAHLPLFSEKSSDESKKRGGTLNGSMIKYQDRKKGTHEGM